MKVKEALEILSKIDPEKEFILDDPDTGHHLVPILYEEDGKVFVTGNYPGPSMD